MVMARAVQCTMTLRRVPIAAMLLALSSGCPSDTGGSGGSGTDTGTTEISTTSAMSSTSMSATSAGTMSGTGDSTDAADPTGGESGDATMGDASSSTDATTGTNDPGNPVDCDGSVYGCGDGIDNDRDGRIDLFDPECTGPCDDDEGSFQTGLPGDNMDCKQDCFFDGNSGQGDDGCVWDLRCDPEDPGALIGCEYTGGNNCNNQPPNQDEDCIEFCEPYVPPGCDCFGCCEVQTPRGPVYIFLNSGPDCALDNLDACQSCTYQIDDCGTPCVPEDCQICFGEDELPEGCDQGGCEIGEPCQVPEDCPTDFYCLLGCCYPPPPG
jgi:hypothetical protein